MATVVGKAEPFKNGRSTLSLSLSWEFGDHTFKEYLDYNISNYKKIVTSLQFPNGFLSSTNHYVQYSIVPTFGFGLFIKFCIEEFQASKHNFNMVPPRVKVNLGIPISKEKYCDILTEAMKWNLITQNHFPKDEFNDSKHSKVYWFHFHWDKLYSSLCSAPGHFNDGKTVLNFEFSHCTYENKRAILATEVGGNERMRGPAKGTIKLFSEEYLFSERFSDFTIQCGAKSFYAHRMVISGKSPVFATMLQQEMKEAKERKLVIKDFKPEAVEEFLRFIYTERANVKDYAKELFQLSHKYQVADLFILSENALISKVEKTNLIDMNELGKLYNSKKLQDKCYAIFKLSRASLLKTKSDVNKFSDFMLRIATE